MRNNAGEPDDLRLRDAYHEGRAPVSERRLWIGVLAAPLAWFTMELVGYSVAARGCDPSRGIPILGATSPSVMQVVLTIAFALIAAWGLLTAIGNWRAVGSASGDEPPEWGRAHFMSFGGTLASALFLLGIVLFGLPPFLVNACSQAR